jgi:outer membrane protein assembly factor BamB
MNVKLFGHINFQGGVEPDVYLLSSNQIALIKRFRAECSVIGLRFNLTLEQVESSWNCELPGDVYHTWAGHRIGMNFASIVPSEKNYLYAIGGTQRLLLNAKVGTVIAHGSAHISPSAPANLIGEELIVPEGQFLAGYDAGNLKLKWRKPTPSNQWIFAQPVGELVLLQHELDQTATLWNYKTNALWKLPNVLYPTKAPLVHDGTIIIPLGGGSPIQLVAFSLTNGSVQWTLNYSTTKLLQEGFPLTHYPLVDYKDSFIVATGQPGLDLLSIVDGSCIWHIDLSSEPTSLKTSEDIVWVSTATGDILAIEVTSGAILSQTTISEGIISVLPLPSTSVLPNAMFITRLGDIYHASL